MNHETRPVAQRSGTAPLRALCIARHCYLSQHIARYFAELGVDTSDAVGLDSTTSTAQAERPDLIICDYDLIASLPVEQWEAHELFSTIPVVAVSLTRNIDNAELLDAEGIAGFLYLPTLAPVPALETLRAAAARSRFILPSRMGAPSTVQHS